MLASSGGMPSGDGWAAEPKWDGFRIIATVSGGQVSLRSRPGSNATEWFPELAELPSGLVGHDAILDGEVVICDNGRPAFHLLRQRLGGRPGKGPRATFMAFDLLWLDGEDTYRLPWSERRARLEALGIHAPCWNVPRYFDGSDLADVQEATRKLGLEGIVLKRTDAPYQPGRRSPAWVKRKHVRHDALVVGAIRPPTGSRPLSGIVVGWPRDDGQLDYAGMVEVGFGPGERALVMGSLERCATDRCPFARPPLLNDLVWVEPALVVEVRSLALATGRWLREPVFSRVVGLRALP
jgi:bifunctional non-homologous end joining protein LigD